MRSTIVRLVLVGFILNMIWACGSGANGDPVTISPDQVKKHNAHKDKDG